jgi:hypothetical protein
LSCRTIARIEGRRTCEDGWIWPFTGSIGSGVILPADSMPCWSDSRAKKEQRIVMPPENDFESSTRICGRSLGWVPWVSSFSWPERSVAIPDVMGEKLPLAGVRVLLQWL